jgi:hypothetical protein
MAEHDVLSTTVQWIESHKTTVDLLKWIAAGCIAWVLGVFKALHEWTRRPSISIDSAYSRGYYEERGALGQYQDVVLLAIIADIQVMNPTGTPLNVRSFELQVKRMPWFRPWTRLLPALGFPSMPRTPMPGGNEKYVPVWFSMFKGFEHQSLKKVDEHDCAAGLAFFAAVISKDELQKGAERIRVRVSVTFASGEKKMSTAMLDLKHDFSQLERTVPHSVDYIRHESVWAECIAINNKK